MSSPKLTKQHSLYKEWRNYSDDFYEQKDSNGTLEERPFASLSLSEVKVQSFFSFERVVGSGLHSKVFEASLLSDPKKKYAIKCMNKAEVKE